MLDAPDQVRLRVQPLQNLLADERVRLLGGDAGVPVLLAVVVKVVQPLGIAATDGANQAASQAEQGDDGFLDPVVVEDVVMGTGLVAWSSSYHRAPLAGGAVLCFCLAPVNVQARAPNARATSPTARPRAAR